MASAGTQPAVSASASSSSSNNSSSTDPAARLDDTACSPPPSSLSSSLMTLSSLHSDLCKLAALWNTVASAQHDLFAPSQAMQNDAANGLFYAVDCLDLPFFEGTAGGLATRKSERAQEVEQEQLQERAKAPRREEPAQHTATPSTASVVSAAPSPSRAEKKQQRHMRAALLATKMAQEKQAAEARATEEQQRRLKDELDRTEQELKETLRRHAAQLVKTRLARAAAHGPASSFELRALTLPDVTGGNATANAEPMRRNGAAASSRESAKSSDSSGETGPQQQQRGGQGSLLAGIPSLLQRLAPLPPSLPDSLPTSEAHQNALLAPMPTITTVPASAINTPTCTSAAAASSTSATDTSATANESGDAANASADYVAFATGVQDDTQPLINGPASAAAALTSSASGTDDDDEQASNDAASRATRQPTRTPPPPLLPTPPRIATVSPERSLSPPALPHSPLRERTVSPPREKEVQREAGSPAPAQAQTQDEHVDDDGAGGDDDDDGSGPMDLDDDNDDVSALSSLCCALRNAAKGRFALTGGQSRDACACRLALTHACALTDRLSAPPIKPSHTQSRGRIRHRHGPT